MTNKRHIFEIEIALKEVVGLKKILKNVPGFRDFFKTTKGVNPEDKVNVGIVFTQLDKNKEKSLKKTMERRGAKIIENIGERNPRITANNKRLLRNSSLYFTVAYLPGIIGIPVIGVNALGINIEFASALLLSLPPALMTFFTKMIIDLKI